MGLDEFDCLVIGDEPAGLWFLKQLYAVSDPSVRLGWISFSGEKGPEALPLPAAVASHFGIHLTQLWSPEIVAPAGSFVWSQPELTRLFPNLPVEKLASNLFKPGLQQTTLAGQAIKSHPELLGYGAALWKVFGRSHRPQPETVLLGALAATQIGFWRACEELPETVVKIQQAPATAVIEQIETLKSGAVSLRFKDGEAILAKRIVFNLPLFHLRKLLSSSTVHGTLSIDSSVMPEFAQYPLRLTVKKNALPGPIRPLSFLLDVDDIPDPDNEIWPFKLDEGETPDERKLTLWVTARRETSLEALQDRYRSGLQRLNRLFPFLPYSILQIDAPLGAETCYSERAREQQLSTLESDAVETYELATLRTHTRIKHVYVLAPFLNCHLPFPMGTLKAAAALVPEAITKKKPKEKPVTTRVEPPPANA